jgi:hypothetical protein
MEPGTDLLGNFGKRSALWIDGAFCRRSDGALHDS